MLWEVDIYAAEGQPDLAARDVAAAAAELHSGRTTLAVTSARGYLIQGDLDRGQVERIADELLADRVVERTVVAPVGDPLLEPNCLPGRGALDPRAAEARRDGPRGPKRHGGHRRLRPPGRGRPHAEKIRRRRR